MPADINQKFFLLRHRYLHVSDGRFAIRGITRSVRKDMQVNNNGKYPNHLIADLIMSCFEWNISSNPETAAKLCPTTSKVANNIARMLEKTIRRWLCIMCSYVL